ncbi:MAG: methyl-accepting chemotaxis protein [Acidimicrobiia bacterium]
MALFGRTATIESTTSRDATQRLMWAMMQGVAINVMFADLDLTIRYVNPASERTLAKIASLLPIPVSEVVGSSIDIFHANPSRQRSILTAHGHFPHHARFPLGPEWVDLTANAVRGESGDLLGFMVNWSLVTDEMRIEREVREVSVGLAATIEELRASVSEIAMAATQSAAVANEAAHEAGNASQVIARLGEASHAVNKVADLIASVADDTNLLALNATIEAARAGEAGRGFGVVAAEVKDLAGETARATDEIATRINAIQQEAVAAASAVHTITSIIEMVRDSSASIAAAVEEQSAAAEEIARTAAIAAEIVNRRS